jgi:hypothetical protein
MTALTDALDALFTAAEAKAAKPFRLELQQAEIESLEQDGALDPKPSEHDSALGLYRGVKVYAATRDSELFAQPADELLALHLLLKGA